uniref:Uncharacterized protein n=1 Tax=Arundo donax TaxID=35708 RepID=A0A0A9EC79_ARUDO
MLGIGMHGVYFVKSKHSFLNIFD